MPKFVKDAFRASLTGLGLLGWLIALAKPIAAGLSMASDVDLLANYFGAIGKFLETGWGTLASVVLGAIIIGYAIHRRTQLEPIGVSIDTDVRRYKTAYEPPSKQQNPLVPQRCENLFAIDDHKVRLKFFPDTEMKRRRSDGLLLIIYAYEVLAGAKKVGVSAAHRDLESALWDAQNSPLHTATRITGRATWMFMRPELDYGREYIDESLLVRDGLSVGGVYRLTDAGRVEAERLAREAIANA